MSDPMAITKIEEQTGGEVMKAIGELITTAAAVDQSIGLQILRILGAPNIGALPVVCGMQIKVKLNVINLLISVHKPRDRKEVAKLCNEIRDAFVKRDVFAHSTYWQRKPDEHLFQQLVVTKEGRLPPPQAFTLSQIIGFSNTLRNLSLALDKKLGTLGFPKL